MDKIDIPTKILAAPTGIEDGRGGIKVKLFHTDKGYFTTKELANILGMSLPSFYRRLEKGWDHPDVLKEKRNRTFTDGRDLGNDEWRALSDEVRSYNLKKIGNYENVI